MEEDDCLTILTLHNRLPLASPPQQTFGWPKSEEWPRNTNRYAGLGERFGGNLFRRTQKKLIPQHKKCLNLDGNCVEK
jgi:hypothetical protein